jgi:hypothetical protein
MYQACKQVDKPVRVSAETKGIFKCLLFNSSIGHSGRLTQIRMKGAAMAKRSAESSTSFGPVTSSHVRSHSLKKSLRLM